MIFIVQYRFSQRKVRTILHYLSRFALLVLARILPYAIDGILRSRDLPEIDRKRAIVRLTSKSFALPRKR